ncbi:MAG: hypothetical protein EUB_02239 [Eubacterium sp.]|uniref:hypothetical protein n=1 Tax=Eubacterium sp. TaxID=142586 RepID=UPI0030286AFE
MKWEEYYAKFYDWTTGTQINKLSSLTTFGEPVEVSEVAQELMDEAAASRLLKKAVAYGVQFPPNEIYELSCCCDTDTLNLLLESSSSHFTKEQLEDLWGIADDDVLLRIAEKNGVLLSGEEVDDDYEIDGYEPDDEFKKSPAVNAPKMGFFSKLFIAMGIANGLTPHKDTHPGHCTGDCANCPPHYGYRYGRWYYGHGHVHGCEFGGNKGDGSR